MGVPNCTRFLPQPQRRLEVDARGIIMLGRKVCTRTTSWKPLIFVVLALCVVDHDAGLRMAMGTVLYGFGREGVDDVKL